MVMVMILHDGNSMTITDDHIQLNMWFTQKLMGWGKQSDNRQRYPTPYPVYQPNCGLLLKGDQNEIDITQEMLYVENRQSISDNDYTWNTMNCTHFNKIGGYSKLMGDHIPNPVHTHSNIITRDYLISRQSWELNSSYPIAFIINAASSAEQFDSLLHSIYAAYHVYCVTLNGHSPPGFASAIRGIVNCLSNVFISVSFYSAVTKLEAEMQCMQLLMADRTEWKYVINMEDQSVLLQPQNVITRMLIALEGHNKLQTYKQLYDITTNVEYHNKSKKIFFLNITSTYHKTLNLQLNNLGRNTTIMLSHLANVTLFYGSPFYILSRDFITTMVPSVLSEQLFEWIKMYHQQTPSEVFWVSLDNEYRKLKHHNNESETGAYHSHLTKWSTAHLNVHQACLYHFNNISHLQHKDLFVNSETRHTEFCIYNISDLKYISSQPFLFAARFSIEEDHVAMSCLNELLQHKNNFW